MEAQHTRTIQIPKSKERYLESRVESLANQITKTVRDYEMRLACSSSDENNLGGEDTGMCDCWGESFCMCVKLGCISK